MKETPYKLIFEAEVLMLIEVSKPSLRRSMFDEEINIMMRKVEIGLIKEEREMTQIREEAIKVKIAKKYNKNVDPRYFRVRDYS